MTVKQSWLSRAARAFRLGLSGVAVLGAAAGLTAGCLDRPVAPAEPRTSNVFVELLSQQQVDKIDLLFMIDNSISMADKQAILSEAVPVLVDRLINPVCVDGDGNPAGSQPCGGGSAPEFNSIDNIHIGVITSALGNHGGDVCSPGPDDVTVGRTPNDAAQLLPTVNNTVANRVGLYSWNNSGFLVWDPRDPMIAGVHANRTMAETDPNTFVNNFASHVTGAGELGCGYESSLEAWYRFLIDPEPVANMGNDGQFSIRDVPNQEVLAQRAAFLRPDSLLAIIMLSDENDCSIVDEDANNALGYNPQGWLVGRTGARMPRASDGCNYPGDPNRARCCRPCVVGPAEGCPDNAADPQCALGATLTVQEDSTNLRCFKQRQRFGIDLLYDIQRYVDGLSRPLVYNRLGQEVPNPIFQAGADGTPARDAGLVFLAGIIGVPWQDIATEGSLQGRGLTYLTADQIRDNGRWDVILGNPATGVQPTDPLMIEQVDPRPTGAAHPILGVAAAVADASSTNQQANPINGHEQNVVGRDDLQYACIFPLNPPTQCTMANQDGCDCNAGEAAYNRPLCQYPQGTTADGTQNYAKAYPGTRHLQALRDFGSNAIVASICPKNVTANGNPASDPDYGYNPAVAAIIDRLKDALTVKCLPRPLSAETDMTSPEAGKVPCLVVEASRPPAGAGCSCNNGLGRFELEGEKLDARGAVVDELRNRGVCGTDLTPPCGDYCMCEIQQFTGGDLQQCQNEPVPPASLYGYCYVDPDNGQGNPALVESCPPAQRRLLRFVGDNVPAKGAIAFIACLGEAVSSGPADPGTGM